MASFFHFYCNTLETYENVLRKKVTLSGEYFLHQKTRLIRLLFTQKPYLGSFINRIIIKDLCKSNLSCKSMSPQCMHVLQNCTLRFLSKNLLAFMSLNDVKLNSMYSYLVDLNRIRFYKPIPTFIFREHSL